MAKKIQKTNAIRMVEQRKIQYHEYTYAWSEDHLDAATVAQQLDAPQAIYKTLVAVGNKTGPLVAVIPGQGALDLKKIAKVSHNKKVEMLHVKELEETTGYIRGGCSPIGMKKLFPTFVDASAQDLKEIIVSAGKRGLQIGLAPADLIQLTRGQFVDILAAE
ncbi:Cys-tRNA(Pro) deacylase [Enterococcus sp. 8G7_MSG3316]|uniref:Cys-tRNA(Pro)/Cys-tRNA(Cys) deacylase n=1 Tax=Candidatus Enterococcus testudinis TaxID=1834191 RepID=A0A242A8H6_9ENTE|nr:Cys-tRNA(Pro) deacylase [Enterococcus sp. 8G7_MSG3316]OTN77190.1 Cys-tRNA(Pro) deacylase [Enterococcus sp. 8G7_MSG3316]